MSSRKDVEALRGILIPSSRIQHTTISATLSSYDQDGPTGGVPTRTASFGAMELESRAAQGTVPAFAVDVRTTRAGSPGEYAGGGFQPGAFVWRGVGATDYYGANDFSTLSGFKPVSGWVSVPANPITRTDAITTPAGSMLIVGREGFGVGARIRVHRIPLSGSPSSTTVATSIVAAPNLQACLFLMPDNKIGMLVLDDYTQAGVTKHNLSLWVSTNDGGTWTKNVERVLAQDLDSIGAGFAMTYRRIRVAYNAGQVLLVIARRWAFLTPSDHLLQYASNDAGASFVGVASATTGNNAGGVHDVVPFGTSGFMVAYCGSDFATWGADSQALCMVVGSAFTSLATAPVTQLKNTSPGGLNAAGNLSGDTQLALVLDEVGVAYCITNTVDGVMLERSTDGETWTRATVDAANLTDSSFMLGNNNGRPQEYSAAIVEQSLTLYGTMTTGARQNQLCRWQFGGYHTHTPPQDTAFTGQTIGSQVVYFASDLPTASGWVGFTVGAPTVSINGSGDLQLTGVAGDTQLYSYTLAPALSTDYTVCAFLDAQQLSGVGGSAAVLVSSAANEYALSVRALSTTQLEISDTVSGVVWATITVPATGWQLRIYVTQTATDARATVWKSDIRGPFANARSWSLDLNTSNRVLTARAPTAGARQVITFGQVGAGTSTWEIASGYVSRSLTNVHGVTYPAALKPQTFSTRYRLLNDYISVRAIGGPTLVGDTWNVSASYRYGIENVDPRRSPSPARTWKADSGSNVIVWEFTDATQLERMLSPLMGLYIGNASFATATLEKRTGAATWTTIGTWDSTAGQSGLSWNNDGDTVSPRNGTAAASFWYPYNGLVGDGFLFDTDAGVITASSDGAWADPAGATKTRTVRLEVSRDPGGVRNGTAGAIMARNACLVFNADPQANAYRLTIPNQPTRNFVDQSYEAGLIILGPIVAFGHRYSWGRQLRSSPNTTLATARDGTRYARNEGATRRAVEFGWTDGVDQSQLGRDQSASSLPDYITNTNTAGGTPLAAAVDGPAMMRGIVEATNGPELPVVYLPWIEPQAAGTNYMIVHRDHMLYGRIVSDVSVEVVQGDEYAGADRRGEVVRTSSVMIEEEL